MGRNKEIRHPGQVRLNVFTEEPSIIVPNLPNRERFDLGKLDSNGPDKKRKFIENKGKPDVAYMNSENLGIIRERIEFDGSDQELVNKLVVFRGNSKDKNKATVIKLDPKIENKKGYSFRLNLSVIAQEVLAIDDFDIPYGHKFYELLGVYNQYKGTGMVSTDKCTRKYATIQRSNFPHPEWLRVGANFFANPNDAIKVEKSKYEKTGYHWKK